jgi:phosphohistidine phosphatase SixA
MTFVHIQGGRRNLLALALIAIGLIFSNATALAQTASTSNTTWDELLREKAPIVLFRHALAPGGGDPPGFKLGDCSTQRNLSDEGKAQARLIGKKLAAQEIKVGAVWHSEWCRTRETAQLAFPTSAGHSPKPQSAFNSFFADRSKAAAQSAQAKKLLATWRGPGALVVITHQVNITEITGVVPQSGEGVVLIKKGNEWLPAARVAP